ncbi:MAG: type I DNA topoisomerase [Alphaproteobacteria bacterium]
MSVVVVESPAKAKTINKYLGDDYVVLASYGHVRDLPSKDGSVRPDDDFAMTYQTDENSVKHLRAVAQALKRDPKLILATDPDREGEAISWHVLNALREEHGLADLEVSRVVFNEITKKAILEAMSHPRELDMDLINAQQARRALDYLVGFTLSPVLWRKLPGARSAGRVQSVALRLVCEREMEIEAFKPQEYWTVDGAFVAPAGRLAAHLTVLDGNKLDKFSLPDEATAMRAVAVAEKRTYHVASVEVRPQQRHPQPPFTTSTLQQEASRKLGFGARQTMQVAQKLYEGIDIGGETVGLITYMRTDGVQMAGEAIGACRDVAIGRYGQSFVPREPREYKTKAKNAQEAHEAIRPTDPARDLAAVTKYLNEDQRRLYDLIWKRAVSSQMASARLQQTRIEIRSADEQVGFRATGTVVEFPGFLRLYEEGHDDTADDEDETQRLPAVADGDDLKLTKVDPAQHFTQPPPRYTEASLVKRLEELGIGRPSTYASILSVLQDRSYVTLDKKRFTPEDKGLLVTWFLRSFFQRYVEYEFTADLEAQLDEVSAGKVDWKDVLRQFWTDFHGAVDETAELRVRDVLDTLDALMAPWLYDGEDGKKCPACADGALGLRLGKFGAFVGCSNYPECKFTRALGAEGADGQVLDGPKLLGQDPDSGLDVTLRRGPYGLYLQLGEAEEGSKPKRTSIPRDLPVDEVDFEMALRLVSLPREVGIHPETEKPIVAGIGRYGPFLLHDGRYVNLASTEELLTIGLNHAVTKIAEAPERRGRPTATPLKELGAHPSDGEPVVIMKGRYGPYVKHGKINATLPNGTEPDDCTLDQAVALIEAKAATKGKKKASVKKAAKKKTAKKTAKKKAPAKKAAAKTAASTEA